jgi:glycosyltransferase involved in cell wall biosynthesis
MIAKFKSKISVAVATYNGGRFILEQLISLTKQNRLPDEIVVCDDQSTDRTVEMVRRVAAWSKVPIRLKINPHNLGFSKNFEKAISLCSGNIIALCDQDDIWLPDKLRVMEKEFEKSDSVAGVFSDGLVVNQHLHCLNYRLWDAFSFKRGEMKKFSHGSASDVLLKHNVITGATIAFRSDCLRYILPIPSDWHHDAWIGLIVSYCGEWVPIQLPLILYRQHASNQIGGLINFQTRFVKPLKINRINFLKNEIGRFIELYNRLKSLNLASHQQRIRVIEKLEHMYRRCDLPKNRLLRITPVWRELAGKRYDRYSKNHFTALKDLIF